MLPLRVRGLDRVRLHADLTILAKLSCALARARAVPLAAWTPRCAILGGRCRRRTSYRTCPGVFSSGDTLDELLEGLQEAVALYLGDGEHAPAEVFELKLAVPA